MSNATFKSNRGEFNNKNNALKDMVMGHMAMDVEIAIKTTAGTPVDTGGMKSEVRHFKSRGNQWRVEAGKEYSAVQEFGTRNGKPFKNYTTSGTSAGWFGRAIDSVVRNKVSYIMEARKALDL